MTDAQPSSNEIVADLRILARASYDAGEKRDTCLYSRAAVEIERLQREQDAAFQMLEVCGVPRERARTIANGISVLDSRYQKERTAHEPGTDWKTRAETAEGILSHNMALANANTRHAKDERNTIIRKMRERYSAAEIADMAGLTRQRVHQILNEAPLPVEDAHGASQPPAVSTNEDPPCVSHIALGQAETLLHEIAHYLSRSDMEAIHSRSIMHRKVMDYLNGDGAPPLPPNGELEALRHLASCVWGYRAALERDVLDNDAEVSESLGLVFVALDAPELGLRPSQTKGCEQP
jgi:hypothetical protein